MRLPGRAGAGTRVRRLARQVDVLPTVLALLSVPPPPSLAGVALLQPGGRPAAHGVEETHAETRLGGRGVAALIAPDWKAIVRQVTDGVELYDLRSDPGERHDLAAARPVLSGYARQRLLQVAAEATTGPGATVAPALDAETIRRLKELGYLD
jgi:arylsulfatase A-like enzyme